MSNMSYCRFENTLSDLQDCYMAIDDIPQSDEEIIARQGLIELCRTIAEENPEE